jgi:hypothetical protein
MPIEILARPERYGREQPPGRALFRFACMRATDGPHRFGRTPRGGTSDRAEYRERDERFEQRRSPIPDHGVALLPRPVSGSMGSSASEITLPSGNAAIDTVFPSMVTWMCTDAPDSMAR